MRPSEALSILFLAVVVLHARVVAAELYTDTACNALADAGNCTKHRLQCSNSAKLFPLQARQGFKPRNSGCASVLTTCNTECCAFNDSDCSKDYTDKEFLDIIEKKTCWNQAGCSFLYRRSNESECDQKSNIRPVYSVIEFACIEDDLIQNFTNTTGASGSEVALTYYGGSTSSDVIITCQVDAASPSEDSSVDVVLYKSKTSAVTVKCQEGQKETSTPSGPTSDETLTSTTDSTSGKDSTFTTDPISPPSSGSHIGIWLIVGVVVVVLVVIVLMVVLAVRCRRRSSRKREIENADGEPPVNAYEVVPLQGSSDHSQERYSALPGSDGAEDRSSEAAGKSTSSVPASSSSTSAAAATTAAASAAAATTAASADTDYDHLGKMRPATAPHDVTYGHLQVNNDVTGDDYDHVGRLGQASGSQRVIDNIYNTAGPAGSTSCFDDNVDYNVTGTVNTQGGDGMSSAYDVVTPSK